MNIVTRVLRVSFPIQRLCPRIWETLSAVELQQIVTRHGRNFHTLLQAINDSIRYHNESSLYFDTIRIITRDEIQHSAAIRQAPD